MSDDSGSSAVLGVIVGAVIVIGLIFFAFGGFGLFNGGGGGGDTNISVDVPSPTPSP